MKGKKGADINSPHGLSAKHLIFCEQFLIDRNGKQAAIRTGYAANSAEVTASKLLRNAKVAAYIDSKITKLLDKFEITQEEVMREYARIGFSDIRQYFNEDGGLKAIHELSDEAAAALASIETEELFEGFGEERRQIGVTRKLKLWDKRGALDGICKMKGWNAPKEVKHTGKIRIGYGKEED